MICLALMAVAEALRLPEAPVDPDERAGWAAGGDPFTRAGLADPLDGLPFDRNSLRAAASEGGHGGAWLAREARRAARDPARLGALHQRLSSRAVRHARGQFYTPAPAVEQVLDCAGYPAAGSLLDPMCGAGAFLMAALRRLAATEPELDAASLAARVHGLEVDPVAVLLARAGCLITLAQVRDALAAPPGRAQVEWLDPLQGGGPPRGFETIAGNPPWVSWDALPREWRDATANLWRRHGLFAEDGRRGDMQAVLGRGRKDLAMLATSVAADGWLKPGGTLSFIVTRALLKSVGSGAGFRRFVLPDGTPLRVVEVRELDEGTFPRLGARPVILTLLKGEPTRYPVVWRAKDAALLAEPVDSSDPCSAWLTVAQTRREALRRILGRSAWQARTGAYTGGANGVYWMRRCGPEADGLWEVVNLPESGKRSVQERTVRLEPGLLFPLLRARGVSRFAARPEDWILLPQDAARRQGIDEPEMRRLYPRALAYLESMDEALRGRRDRGTRALIRGGAPRWTLFGVSRDTLAPWKAVWPRIASKLTAAVVGPHQGRPVIPQETCTLIACHDEEEASFVAGLLNATLCQEAAASFADTGGKSFGAPHLLRHIAVPRFDARDAGHRALARAVMQRGPDLSQEELDRLAERVWPGAGRNEVKGGT